jgi:flagellar protein FliO/FliZ
MRLSYLALIACLMWSLYGVAQDSDNADALPQAQSSTDTVAESVAGQPPMLSSDRAAQQKDALAGNEATPADSSKTRPSAGLGLGKMALSLTIVVAIVIALGWVFKKLTLRLPGSRHIKIISTMPLGPKERLLVIEIQGKQRVLGVTAHSINLLFELENSLPEEKLASDFHTQLQSFLKK